MEFLKKYLSRRWLTHVVGLIIIAGLAWGRLLDSRDIMLGIVLIVASEGGSNVADFAVHVLNERNILKKRDKEDSHDA